MFRVLGLLGVLTLLVAACGGKELDRSSSLTRPPSTPVFIPTATSTIVPRLTDVDVKQALVTLTDLPSTWYDADTRSPTTSDAERCEVANPFAAHAPVADATSTFAYSQTGPWIAETIFQLETPDDTRALMADLRRSFGCSVWVQVVELGPQATPSPASTATAEPTPDPGTTPALEQPVEVSWDISSPSDLKLRNEAFITRMISNTTEPVEFELVFVRENNLLVQVSHWSREGVNTDVTMSVVDRSLVKLDETFGS